MSDQPLYIPPSRFVSGSITAKRTTNARRQPIPEDKQQYEFGLAMSKTAPTTATFFAELQAMAKTECAADPQKVYAIEQWFQTMQGFSMKVADGDSPNLQGKINENTVGCFVVYLSSSFPINCANPQNIEIDPKAIERGYYVDATASISANSNPVGDGAGIYMNPQLVRLLGVGEIIRGGIDVASAAAAMPAPTMPVGAQPIGSAPMVGNSPPPTGMPAQQQQQQQAYGQPAQQQQQMPAQQQQQQPPAQQQQMPGVTPQQGYAASPAPTQANTMPGVQGGMPQTAGAVQPGQTTASPTSTGHPPHAGILPGQGGDIAF